MLKYSLLELVADDEQVALEREVAQAAENEWLEFQSLEAMENYAPDYTELKRQLDACVEISAQLLYTCSHMLRLIHGHHSDLEVFDEDADEYVRPYDVEVAQCAHPLCVVERKRLALAMMGEQMGDE